MTSPLLTVARAKLRLQLEQYADRLKAMVAENKAMGIPLKGQRKQRDGDATLSAWSRERARLTREMKSEIAALVNRAYQAAYQEALQERGNG